MALDFELTISGICVIVLKSQDNQPKNPMAVDVLCLDAPGHKARLVYRPERVVTEVEPDLCIDSQGTRFASLDLAKVKKVLKLDFGANPHTKFSLDWGITSNEVPSEEKWMRWVPSDQDLGLKGIRIEKDPDKLPAGASARLTLQPGEIEARNVVRDRGTGVYINWKFPAKDINRAVANEVVYRARGVQHVKVFWGGGGLTESVYISRSGKLEMAITNDLAIVPSKYNDPPKKLEHLAHLKHLADPYAEVQVPEIVEDHRTGRPICNQIYFVDKS